MTTTASRRTAEEESTAESGALDFYLIAGAAFLLLVLGVVMVLSATTIISIRDNDGNPFAEFLGQAKFVLIGVPLLIAAAFIPMEHYKRLAWPALIGSIGLQLLIFTPLARGQGGNVNWIFIPGLNQTVQPSEFMKVGLALWLGAYIAKNAASVRDFRVMWPVGAVSLLVLGLVMYGHDMGTAIVLVILVVGALWVAGLPGSWFAAVAVLGAAVLTGLVFMSDSRVTRVLQFLGVGEADPTGAGYQSEHGMWGLGTGGVFGVGLGASREKWAYLPEAHNDFIFAILGEELGLIGTLLVLVLFGVLTVGLFRMVRRHPDPFVKITTAAVASWLVGQALVNIGVVIGLLPVIGVPLPLVSAGGSAMISSLLALGMMLSFARSEPGARQALSTSTAAVRRSLAVVGRSLGRKG